MLVGASIYRFYLSNDGVSTCFLHLGASNDDDLSKTRRTIMLETRRFVLFGSETVRKRNVDNVNFIMNKTHLERPNLKRPLFNRKPLLFFFCSPTSDFRTFRNVITNNQGRKAAGLEPGSVTALAVCIRTL